MRKNKINIFEHLQYFLILILALSLLPACTVSYSFTGSSLDYTKVKTISIANFPNRATLVYPALAPTFTEQLKETFSSKTSLNQVPKNGDLQISGEITGYSLSPSAINSSGSSTMTRLTVVVRVVFVNRSNSSENFEKLIERVKTKVGEMTKEILDGRIDINPYKKGQYSPCSYCKFQRVCAFDNRQFDNNYRKIGSTSVRELQEKWNVAGKED